MIEGRVLVYRLMADRAPRAYIRRGSCLKGVPGDAWDPTVLAPGTFRGRHRLPTR